MIVHFIVDCLRYAVNVIGMKHIRPPRTYANIMMLLVMAGVPEKEAAQIAREMADKSQ